MHIVFNDYLTCGNKLVSAEKVLMVLYPVEYVCKVILFFIVYL